MLDFLKSDFLNRSHTKYNHNHKFLPLIGGWSLDLDSVVLDKENRKLTALICKAGNTIVSMEYFELPFNKDNSKQYFLKETATYSFQTESYIERKRPDEISKFEHESAISRVYNLYQNEFGSNIQGGINSTWRFVETGDAHYCYDIRSILYNGDKSVRVIVSKMEGTYIHEYAIIMYADKNNRIKVLEEAVFDAAGVRLDTYYSNDWFWDWEDVFIKMYDDIIDTGLELVKSSTISHEMGNDYKGMQSRLMEATSSSEIKKELDNLIGLKTVKNEVNSLINILKVNKVRSKRGMKQVPMSKHLVFSGNPGTGKTTVARILAKIYKELGVLSQGQLVEVDRSKLVAGYIGQTAIKTQKIIDQSLGGILFIDEAYTLIPKSSNDFGTEAIDTILKAMEDNRDDFIVIVAGYPDLMQEFLNSNPGLRSRFNKFINFEDYTPDELTSIFKILCEKLGYAIDDGLDKYLYSLFENWYNNRDREFANGRTVRNFFEKVVANQANRLEINHSLSDKELMILTLNDIKAAESDFKI